MSFRVNWSAIEKNSLSSWTMNMLNNALNTGDRPNMLSSEIKIEDLSFGEQAPDFEILEIGDLGADRFRGIFKLNYNGDASITLRTRVQANPLRIYNDNVIDNLKEQSNSAYSESIAELSQFVKPQFVTADESFSIPLNLKLSQIRISTIIIIVFTKSKGLTLVFKNDPLESISISSTFDKIKPLAQLLQKKIEVQISELFKEFLPSILYKFSLKYTTESFDQFHKDLLKDELDDALEKRVNFKDIDPEAPMGISPGSLMRLTTLATARQTLALGGKLSADRMNSDIITKSYVNHIVQRSYNNRLRLSESDSENISKNIDMIRQFQTKSYYRHNNDNPHHLVEHGEAPKRRVIKMKRKKAPSAATAVSAASTPVPSATPSVNPSPARIISQKFVPEEQPLHDTAMESESDWSSSTLMPRSRKPSGASRFFSTSGTTLVKPTLKPDISSPVRSNTSSPLLLGPPISQKERSLQFSNPYLDTLKGSSMIFKAPGLTRSRSSSGSSVESHSVKNNKREMLNMFLKYGSDFSSNKFVATPSTQVDTPPPYMA